MCFDDLIKPQGKERKGKGSPLPADTALIALSRGMMICGAGGQAIAPPTRALLPAMRIRIFVPHGARGGR